MNQLECSCVHFNDVVYEVSMSLHVVRETEKLRGPHLAVVICILVLAPRLCAVSVLATYLLALSFKTEYKHL